MNYLELCQRLVRETGIADSGPTSVEGQTGDMKRITDWVNDAWVQLQSMRADWGWMWGSGTSTLSSGSHLITLSSTVESVKRVTVGGAFLQRADYDEFANAYRVISDGIPSVFAVRPDGVLIFNAEPTSDLTVSYEYYSRPTSMAVNNDAPSMPPRYHMIIVYSALREYALFDVAPELEKKAFIAYESLLADLERDQLAAIQAAGALA